jgi:hypothetical protein
MAWVKKTTPIIVARIAGGATQDVAIDPYERDISTQKLCDRLKHRDRHDRA